MRLDPPVIERAIQRMICTGCGAEANVSCTCGVAYVPAAQRAANAVKANPEKSNRAIAEEIGVDEKTVRKARGADQSAPEGVTGRDGKTYPTRRQRTGDPELEPDEERAYSAFLIRADAAARAAFYTRGEIDSEIIKAAEETLAVWQRLVGALKGGRYVEEEEV